MTITEKQLVIVLTSYGGFNRGELNIFASGSGSGKSLILQEDMGRYAARYSKPVDDIAFILNVYES